MALPALRVLAILGPCRSGPLWRWRWPLGVLEGGDLGKELVILMLQLLSFMGCIFLIMRCLLPLVVKQGLLLCHLLLHVSEHLEELAFVH